ncbi:MAG: zonular occludens toxin domain-containing protein [Sulfurihydrogenibium sp.]|jgi:zona occludens toxin|nr:zonular occludens toxin domain-containing protein [Sulfurihydrogenibium sp.]MBX0312995.1 zonular occludens toxin domain-containing protein [Sulfurihydrogenibium sp.]
MLSIIYGVPGSGKSYYAVYQIKKMLDEKRNITLISNIENLKLTHLNLDELIYQYGGIEKFFNVECDFWKTDVDKKKVLFIDEAQRYFNKRFFSSFVFFFFQYHRHLNIDIYLITQSYKTLPTELVVLAEIVIQAVPSSFRWFRNSFRYLVKDLETFETVERIDVPFKKEIAELYTSALVVEPTKKLTYTQKYLLGSAVLFVVAVLILVVVFPKVMFSTFAKHSPKSDSKAVATASSPTKQSSAVNLPTLPYNPDDGFEYPNGITTAGYKQKEISYGEFLNTYQNGVVYDLGVNYIIIYDKNNKPKKVIIYKEEKIQKEAENQNTEEENQNQNLNLEPASSNLAENPNPTQSAN